MKFGRPWIVAGIAAYVFGSSIAGLTPAMLRAGLQIFGIVWGASFLGDLLFVGGTVAVGWGSFELARRRQGIASVLAGAVGTWLVYTVAWSVTAPAISPENNAGFQHVSAAAWTFTFQWGWFGILVAGLVPFLAFHVLHGDEAPAPAKPAPPPVAPAPPETAVSERPPP